MGIIFTHVTDAALDRDAHLDAVASPHAGAVVAFFGVIRDHDPEASGEVTAIDYTFHPDAATMLRDMVSRVLSESDPDGDALVAVSHRVGRLEVGESALACCVSTSHRRAAFELCDRLVETIKAELPIWKQQFEVDGGQTWSRLWAEGPA